MIIYQCIKFQSNTPILSKDIARKPKVLRTGRTDVPTDSGDTICAPIENGGGIKKIHGGMVYEKGFLRIDYKIKNDLMTNDLPTHRLPNRKKVLRHMEPVQHQTLPNIKRSYDSVNQTSLHNLSNKKPFFWHIEPV